MAATPPSGGSYGTEPAKFSQQLRPMPQPSRRPLYTDLGIIAAGLCLLVPIVVFVRDSGTAKVLTWSVIVTAALVVGGRVRF